MEVQHESMLNFNVPDSTEDKRVSDARYLAIRQRQPTRRWKCCCEVTTAGWPRCIDQSQQLGGHAASTSHNSWMATLHRPVTTAGWPRCIDQSQQLGGHAASTSHNSWVATLHRPVATTIVHFLTNGRRCWDSAQRDADHHPKNTAVRYPQPTAFQPPINSCDTTSCQEMH